jgi:hypothetical protein
LGVKDLDHLGEVSQRTGKPIYFVDNHHIDQLFVDIGQQALQSRPVHRGA